jgi:hypothetical protein
MVRVGAAAIRPADQSRPQALRRHDAEVDRHRPADRRAEPRAANAERRRPEALRAAPGDEEDHAEHDEIAGDERQEGRHPPGGRTGAGRQLHAERHGLAEDHGSHHGGERASARHGGVIPFPGATMVQSSEC